MATILAGTITQSSCSREKESVPACKPIELTGWIEMGRHADAESGARAMHWCSIMQPIDRPDLHADTAVGIWNSVAATGRR